LTPSALRKDDGDFTRAFRPADEERIRTFVLGYPGVAGIRELLLTFVGPGRVWVVARIDVDGNLRGAQIQSLVRGIESGMKAESEDIYRVDVVPIGEEPAAQI
jgi:divalent metal cation (Fe/Co/Zn/Cd) transporter